MARTVAPIEENKRNTIAGGTKIKGDLVCDGDIRIDGEIEGTIQCKGKLVLGPDGRLKGEVLYYEGDKPDFFYIVAQGSCTLLKKKTDEEI